MKNKIQRNDSLLILNKSKIPEKLLKKNTRKVCDLDMRGRGKKQMSEEKELWGSPQLRDTTTGSTKGSRYSEKTDHSDTLGT